MILKCLNKPRALKALSSFLSENSHCLLLTLRCILIEIDTFASFKTLADDFNTAEPFGIANGFALSDCGRETLLCVSVHHLGGLDLAGRQILVVLQGVVAGWVVEVGWARILVERRVGGSHRHLVVDEVVEVEVREDAVVGHAVVGRCGLEVVQVGESSAVRGTQPEWHVLVAVIDGVALAALKEAEEVVLDDGVLLDGAGVGASGLSADAVTDREDILELVMLQGVAVDINHASAVADTRVEDEFVLLARWVDVGVCELMLINLARVDVLEGGDISVVRLANLDHFPAKVNFDSTLGTLLKSDLVGVGEGINELVGGPVLDFAALSCDTDELVLTEESLVV